MVDAGRKSGRRGGEDGVAGGVGGVVEVRLAEHVALADDAGRDADGVDGAVELGVRGGHEHLLEPPAAVGPRSREHRRGHADVACAGAARDGGAREQGLAFGADVAHGRHGVDDERELVDEFEGRRSSAVGQEAAQLVDHATGDVLGDPDVAVEGPHDIAPGLAVCPAHVPDLGVRADVVGLGALVGEVRVVRLHEDLGVEVGEVGDKAADDGIGGVLFRLDAEVDGQLVSRIRLVKDGSETFVEAGFEALGRSDDGDMGDLGSGQSRRDGLLGY